MDPPTRVVCLGGGYVAVHLYKSLRRAILRGDVKLDVVDQNNFHTFHGLIPEMLGGKIQPGNVISPARRLFAAAQFHLAEIQSVDVDRKRVMATKLIDGNEVSLDYDHLVIAIGSVDDLTRYPGISEHAFRLKSYWDCFKVRHHLMSMLELGEVETDPEERKRLLTFVIAGGNYAGIEVSAEINEMIKRLSKKEYRGINPDEARVVVIHSRDKILPELGNRFPGLQAYAQQQVAKQGVELLLNSRMSSASPIEAMLNDGTQIPTRTIISCTGSAQSPILESLPFERDERGRLLTDEFIRVLGREDVWAAGDCGAVPHPRGGYCPPLAIYAMRCGRQIGKNIKRLVAKKTLKPYGFAGLGDALSVSHRRAVLQLKDTIKLKGFVAWVCWRMFMLAYLPSWDRRVRVFLDWLVWPFVGSDIVSVSPDDQLAVRSGRYEPGQVIIRQGDIGKTLYVIRTGEVEVVDEDSGSVLAVLGAGKHFGEIAVFQNSRRTATVRSKTVVEVLEIQCRAAGLIRDALKAVKEEAANSSNG